LVIFINMFKKIIFCLFFVLINNLIFAGDLSVTARVDKQKIAMNEQLIYEVIISGLDMSNVPKPVLPDFNGVFEVDASVKTTSFSLIAGQYSSSITSKYTLIPNKICKFVIEPTKIEFEGQLYETAEIAVEVVTADVVSTSNHAPSNNAVLPEVPPGLLNNPEDLFDHLFSIQRQRKQARVKGNIFVRASVDKQEVYVGEQIVFNLDFYRQIKLWSNISFEIPGFQGFWVEPLIAKKDEVIKNIDGKQFYSLKLAKNAIFPLKQGEIVISPSRVGFVVNPFEGQRVLASNQIIVKVKPLPTEGMPENFSGLVGSFNISAQVNLETVNQNSPISMKIVVQGDGNIKNISDLVYTQIPELKIYKSKVEDDLSVEEKIEGRRVFEYVVIPRVSGELIIPSFSLNYFSTSGNVYVTKDTEPIRIVSKKVQATIAADNKGSQKQELEVIRDSITYLKSRELLRPYSNYAKTKLFWIVIVLDFGVLLGALVFFINRFIKKDLKQEKRLKAYEVAIKKLIKLKEKFDSDPASLSKIENILLEFLTNKTGESLAGIASEDVIAILTKHGLKRETLGLIRQVFDDISFQVYAPSKASAKSVTRIYNGVIKITKELKSW
jgi:hypothetical protein